MKKGKVGNSHDNIMYAINGWAAWGFHKDYYDASDIYINSKLRLFNCIGSLFAGRIKKTNLPTMQIELQDCLIEHAALFPPSESTYALHELIHCCSQIDEIGPPRFNCLFMFERVNLFLKRMVKNRCSHLASIVKGYALEEYITQTIGYDLTKLNKVVTILSCMPTNCNLVKKILTSFANLYIDEDDVMYSLPNARVHELRGNTELIVLNETSKNNLIKKLSSYSRDNSVLGKLLHNNN